MQEELKKRQHKLISTLGQIVKTHRTRINKTIYSISAEVSMSKSTWREVELGICKDVKLSTLWKIAEGLEIPIGELLRELSSELGKDFNLSDFD